MNKKSLLNRILLIILTLIIITHQKTSEFQNKQPQHKYSYIPSYLNYTEQWLKIVPYKYVHNLTNVTNQLERCEQNKPCQYFVYEYSYQSQNHDHEDYYQNNNNITIFVLAGLHGNQHTGPITILNAFPYLKEIKPYKLLIFPIGNPSGYIRKQRKTFPNQIDANRDFPFDSNPTCYRTDSTFVIDYIYRNWKIDLSISLHNGGNQIGWAWGSFSHKNNSFTVQQPINKQIGKALQYHGGANKQLNMSGFKIGTMTQSVYPAQGTYEDWAYAGSWELNGKICTKQNQKQFQTYPENMNKGLIFLFQLSPHNVSQFQLGSEQGVNMNPNQTSSHNGYISRGIRMLKQLIYATRPQLEIQISQNAVYLQLMGCKTGLLNFTLKSKRQNQQQNDKNNLQSQNQHYLQIENKQIKGSLYAEESVNQNDNARRIEILQYKMSKNENYQYNYELNCDIGWNNLGNTAFGKPRIIKGKGLRQIQNGCPFEQQYFSTLKDRNQKQIQKEYQNLKIFVGMMMTIIVITLIVIYCMYTCSKNRQIKRLQKVRQFVCQSDVQSAKNQIIFQELKDLKKNKNLSDGNPE